MEDALDEGVGKIGATCFPKQACENGRSAPIFPTCDNAESAALGQAMLYLVLIGEHRLCRTLGLIVENRQFRDESIKELMESWFDDPDEFNAAKVKYFRHRSRLLEIFDNNCDKISD